ncbi:hypothetical protein ACVBEQ_04770 [Nakamurella sp. GG22]
MRQTIRSFHTQDLLNGDLGAHRDLPVDTEDDPEPPAPVTPAVSRPVYTTDDAQRAWARRQADLTDIASVENILNRVDARAKELQQRTAAILAAETHR